MLRTWGNFQDAVKSFLAAVWITFGFCSLLVHGQEGDGCGHSLLGPESGTLASQNYGYGTYPNNTRCTWRLWVPQERTLRLVFGDFDIESSPGCGNGSLVITDKSGERFLGPVCGKFDVSQKNVTLKSSDVTVTFTTGTHRTGRGFLLSYATDQYPDLISCAQRGSHFNSQQMTVYCPAGCKSVAGDVWGNSEQGYRDTSVLCKSAVHAGAASDSVGGRVTVSRERSLTLYESTFANGILSKMGSLSTKKLLFIQECNNNLMVSAFNASSFWKKNVEELRRTVESDGQLPQWTADSNDPNPWVELELSERSTITGVITSGSVEHYTTSYVLFFSKDRKNWKFYKDALTKEKKVFQSYTDAHLRVINSLLPPVVARFVRLQAQTWRGRASAQIRVLGCPVAKVTPRSRPAAESPSGKDNAGTPRPSSPKTTTTTRTTEGPVLVESKLRSGQPVIVAVGVVLGLIMCCSCLLVGIWWKRRKKDAQIKYSLPKSCQSFQVKNLPCSESELISYPLERNVHDALPSPPLNDYAEPAVGQKVGSTFRPPSADEAYTTPFILSHYDTPGNQPEYAEPLPPEPEYATPFSDPPCEAPGGHRSPPSGHAQYDCPSHRMLSNGYCTPAVHASGPRPVSAVYAEPRPCDSLARNHTYEEPL